MTEKFAYGMDINIYIEKALEKIKISHPWATKEMFRKNYSYAIEEENGKHVFAAYFAWSEDEVDREVRDYDAEEFIQSIVGDHEWWIEGENKVKDIYEIPLTHGKDILGWNLERYEFRAHELGGYSAQITAGARSTGGSRTFFLPASFFEGTFEEFIEKYNEYVDVPFRLDRTILECSAGLEDFLGLKADAKR